MALVVPTGSMDWWVPLAPKAPQGLLALLVHPEPQVKQDRLEPTARKVRQAQLARMAPKVRWVLQG